MAGSIQAISISGGGRGFPVRSPGTGPSSERPVQQAPFKGVAASKSDPNIDRAGGRKAREKADHSGPQPIPERNTEGIRRALDLLNARLAFSVDKDTGKTIIWIVDNKTDEVIRQIPPEEQLKLKRHIRELLDRLEDVKGEDTGVEPRTVAGSGLLVDEKA